MQERNIETGWQNNTLVRIITGCMFTELSRIMTLTNLCFLGNPKEEKRKLIKTA